MPESPGLAAEWVAGGIDVFDVYGPSLVLPGRLHYPHTDEEFERFGDTIESFRCRARETAIVLVDGAFDVPQPNHDWYLRHVRALGAGLLLEKLGLPATGPNIKDVIGSDAVSVVVTVDADEKINRKKGGLAEKGGIQRPVYPWQQRAERIAGLTFEQDGVVRHVADLVTVEGDSEHIGTPLEDSLVLASFMGRCGVLDGLVVYGEHRETLDLARTLDVRTLVISDETDYVKDPRTNTRWSSSSLIKRIRGEL